MMSHRPGPSRLKVVYRPIQTPKNQNPQLLNTGLKSGWTQLPL
ncbi:hypothetical protein BH09ACT7_BH09ACT7_49380 [soil metagenome]